MKSKLIVMLTYNDKTVSNATEIFNSCKDLPIDNWGFKNVGLSENEMLELIYHLKKANKKIFYEIVSYSKETCLQAAKFACENGIDYLIGTIFYPEVLEYVSSQNIQYFPFVGNVFGSPSILSGHIDDIYDETCYLLSQKVDGIDLLAYRYVDGNPVDLANVIVKKVNTKVIIAGGINSIERINTVMNIDPWKFTMGSALFKCLFDKNGDFRSNLQKVLNIIDDFRN